MESSSWHDLARSSLTAPLGGRSVRLARVLLAQDHGDRVRFAAAAVSTAAAEVERIFPARAASSTPACRHARGRPERHAYLSVMVTKLVGTAEAHDGLGQLLKQFPLVRAPVRRLAVVVCENSVSVLCAGLGPRTG